MEEEQQKVFYNFYISRGSLFELETQLHIAKELDIYAENQSVNHLISEIGKMLNSLITKLKDKDVQ